MTKHFIYVFIFYFIACERNENEVITYVDPDCFGTPGFPSTASQTFQDFLRKEVIDMSWNFSENPKNPRLAPVQPP